ncbi:MAG: TIGR04283 family arsenosugar biosynthesis glycosyltransferase [Gammaproteobacteria bacterium]|nr:TIGR04283 family arsenosugar biosynthesis glycosyltransferase [Gammaproteobacteria bacterium]
MNSLSIIIPVLNEQSGIVERLNALQHFRNETCEILLVDGGSTDATVELATPLVDRLLSSAPGRAVQMNKGAAAARGAVLLFLHIDTVLPKNAQQLLSASGVGDRSQWGWFKLKFTNNGFVFRIISSSMNVRAALTRVCTGDQTLFVARELFHEINGFPELALMEDVAISKILRRTGKPTIVSAFVATSPRRWEKNGILKTILFMWHLRLLYFFGANPAGLARRYYPDALSGVGDSAEPRQSAGTYRYPHVKILLFAKAPVAGEVKTRLQPELGKQGSLQLHLAMTRRVAALLGSQELAPWELWASAKGSEEFFLSSCNKKEIKIQQGADLGQKMAYASALSLAEASVKSVLIIGSDCPSYDAEYLAGAIEALQRGSDVVLGPAEDGGYVLIGMNAPNNALFQGVEWGSDRVLQQTQANIRRLGLCASTLQPLWDVDRPEDLQRLEQLDPPLRWSRA